MLLSVLKLSADNFTFAVPVPLMTTLTRASFVPVPDIFEYHRNMFSESFADRCVLQCRSSFLGSGRLCCANPVRH